MSYAIFSGCNIPARLPQFGDATRLVLKRLHVGWVEIADFNCCGYPMRNTSTRGFALSAARNFALAEKNGVDLLVMCKCCFGSLKYAEHLLLRTQELREDINRRLAPEGLCYSGRVKIRHLLSLLHDEIGMEAVKKAVTRPFNGLVVAASYGCHALRPSEVTHFDDPVNPSLFDELVSATGAFAVEWARRLDCCGAPLRGVNDTLSEDLAMRKITDARDSGAHFMCTACPYSHIQFETVQQELMERTDNWEPIPLILYPQLLGLAMGIDPERLGCGRHRIDIREIVNFQTGGTDDEADVRRGDGHRRRDHRHAGVA